MNPFQDAVVGVLKKMGKSRNQKIKVPNKFRPIKEKAPTNECKCLIFKRWSHLDNGAKIKYRDFQTFNPGVEMGRSRLLLLQISMFFRHVGHD